MCLKNSSPKKLFSDYECQTPTVELLLSGKEICMISNTEMQDTTSEL